ncbi:MAG: HAMP domain-containing protein [Acidobacteria bacterium]|nr:HAMP domain-containing protein [Acidobacteriota bacterium]
MRERLARAGGRSWRLATKLTLALIATLTVVLGAAALLNVRYAERRLLHDVVLGAEQLSSTIVSANWHAMLADRRVDAYEVMRTIGARQEIESIRIFNKEGRVMFSTGADAGTFVDKSAEACYLCHAAERPLVRVDVPSRARVFDKPGGRVMGMVTPIYNEPACSSGACHAHPESVSVLGVLDVSMPLDAVDRTIAGLRIATLVVALLTVTLAAAAVHLFVRRFVGGPLERLTRSARTITAANLDEPIDVRTSDEVGELAASFEAMRERLRHALVALNELARGLEQKVNERTAQLRAAQDTLVRNSRLASLGQLSATVAHEINNPLSGVMNYAALMERILQPEGVPRDRVEEFRRYLASVIEETARVGRIVGDLLSFSRRSVPHRELQDLPALITGALGLVGHKLELQQVELVLDFEEHLPRLYCDGSQLRQVVVNLAMNAADAMPGGGRLRVAARADGDEALILEVADTGGGVAPDVLPHVFDPFFTTKKDGQGAGLGLAVVYGIVSAHEGTIELDSAPGQGTTVRVRLPLVAAPAPEPA